MSEITALDAAIRQDKGKGASRRLRRLANLVPAIIYGGDKAPIMISIEQRLVRKALEDEGFYSRIITLNIDGQTEKVVLKDLQRHPYKLDILHMDFLRVSENEKIHMHVPIHFIGEQTAPGLKQGGIISKEMIETEITCLPADLPEFLSLDVGQMALDDSLHLSDISVPNGVTLTLLNEAEGQNPTVASLHRPKVVAEEAPAQETGDGEAATDGDDNTKGNK